MSSVIGSIAGFAGTEAVGVTRPGQFGLALTAQAEFIICNKSIDEVFLTIHGERHGLDHGIGHFMIFEVDLEAQAPAPPIPKWLQTSSAASDRRTVLPLSSRQAG